MDFEVPKKIEKVVGKFLQTGAEIYVVGGAVRDLILKKQIKDWDFTTNLTPAEMSALFPRNSFCNNNFGTFSIVGENDEIFEVTTFRTEQGYSDSRHPDEVKWGKSLEEDLQRRDFTINAISLEPIAIGENYEWSVIDLYGGREDIEKKLIRTVGNPDERFKEDALRMMRAVRIASQIGFTIEQNTFESIKENATLINHVSGERIRDELLKILKSEFPADGIKLLRNCGLLTQIIPELEEGIDMKQKGHHIDDVWTHNLKSLENCDSPDPITRLAALLHDVGKPRSMAGEGEARTFHNHEVIGSRMAVGIGKRLRLSNVQIEQLFRLVRWHMFTVAEIQTDKAVRRFIRNVTPEFIDNMISMRRADRIGSGSKETSWRWELFKKRIVEVQKQPFSIKDLKVNGQDVMEILGIKPGPKVGQILNEIFAQVDEKPELNDRDVLVEKIKEYK